MNNTATDDLDPLARGLLAAVAEDPGCRRLDTVLSEFCHALRNRMNVLKLGIYLAQQSAAGPAAELEPLTGQYRGVEALVESVQSACRPIRLACVMMPLGSVLEERRTAWSEALAAQERTLEWSPPRTEAPAALDPGMLTHALDEVVAWRSAVGLPASTVRVSWHTAGADIRLDWEESGPASGTVAAADPGRERLPALAVPLLARVAAAHGGRLELPAGGGPFRLSVFLPATRADHPASTPAPASASTPARAARQPAARGRA